VTAAVGYFNELRGISNLEFIVKDPNDRFPSWFEFEFEFEFEFVFVFVTIRFR